MHKDPESFNTKAAGRRTEEEIPKASLLPLFFSPLDRAVVNDIAVNDAVTDFLKAKRCLGPLLVGDIAEQVCLQWKARTVVLVLEGNC